MAAGLEVRAVLLVALAVLDGVVALLADLLLPHADLDLGLGGAVLGVLDELLLGHLEALGLATAGFVDRVHGGGVGEGLLEVARRAPADVADLARGGLGLLLGERVVLVGHLSAPGLNWSRRGDYPVQSLTHVTASVAARVPAARRGRRARPARRRAARARSARRDGARWRRG